MTFTPFQILTASELNSAFSGLPDGTTIKYNNSNQLQTVQRIAFSFSYDNGTAQMPGNGSMMVGVAVNCQIPASGTGSFGVATVGATNSASLSLKRDSGGTITTLGSFNFASAGSGGRQTATLSGFSGSAVNINAGDRLYIPFPTVPDPTLAGMVLTVYAVTI